jgi:hypothetical protein
LNVQTDAAPPDYRPPVPQDLIGKRVEAKPDFVAPVRRDCGSGDFGGLRIPEFLRRKEKERTNARHGHAEILKVAFGWLAK